MGKKTRAEIKAAAAEKAAKKAQEKAEKAAAPKVAKPRKPRAVPPVRTYKDSPSGHFEDILRVALRRIEAVKIKTDSWPAGVGHIDDVIGGLKHEADRFHGLSVIVNDDQTVGYKPPHKARGRVAKNPFVVNQQVTMDSASMERAKRVYPAIDVDCVFRISSFAMPGEKLLPVDCCGIDGNLHPRIFLGYIARKDLSPFVEPSNAVNEQAA